MDKIETVVWDVETAGLELSHPTIQIAAIAVKGWEETDSFQVKIRFDAEKADPAALELNCYNAEAWEREAVEPAVAIAKLDDWLRRHATHEKRSKAGKPYLVARVAGWNVRFDCERIERGFRTYERFLPAASFEALDVMQVARGHFWEREQRPENLKLATVAKWFGIDTLEAHDALADVRLAMRVAQKLVTWAGAR